jgi:hypothetical protein
MLLFPELIDLVFDFLDKRDLYTCLFISHQFNEHATRLLYRYVSLQAGFFAADYSNELHRQQVSTFLAELDDGVGIQEAGIIVGKHISETCRYSTHTSLGHQPIIRRATADGSPVS